jgi:hypothetical protein
MQQNFFGQFIVYIVAIMAGVWLYWAFQAPKNTLPPAEGGQKPAAADPANSTFKIDGEAVTLQDGTAAAPTAPGLSAAVVTRYFGSEVRGDFNSDSVEDVAFIITREGGGTGTFFYVTALLSENGGFTGTEAVFLGDRITPRTMEYRNGQILVNYLDRKTGEPMSALPSVETTRYFTVSGNELKEIAREMSETDARIIAEATCIKGGEALGPGTYNEATKTWWFNANFNATKPGCNPACVVSAETRSAEVNWRCTGAIPNGNGGGTACSMEAKVCPDGTAVGRTGPNCEFAACPPEASCEGGPCPDAGATIECTAESRAGDVCAQIFDPVCAEVQIQCIKAPCNPVKQTFSSPCEACHNPLVKAYSKGECANQ